MTEPTPRPHEHRPVSVPARHSQRFDALRLAAWGREAIPLTVWPCGSRVRHGHCAEPRLRRGAGPVGVLGPELVGRILLAYTRPGDLVAIASGSCVARPTVEGLRRRCADLTAALAEAVTADLVLLTPSWPSSIALAWVADEVGMAARVLRPGGLLVAVTRAGCRVDPAVGCPPSVVVRAAQQAGFGYLQHNVAVHAPIGGDGFLAGTAWRVPLRTAAGGLPVHRVVHSDVLVFTAPVGVDG